ncbi:hypothetical protein NXY47_00035 [Bacteroides fragilis]|nr:hypothetical protein [Bacteroides fragilis]
MGNLWWCIMEAEKTFTNSSGGQAVCLIVAPLQTDRKNASEYGSNIYDVYLNLKNYYYDGLTGGKFLLRQNTVARKWRHLIWAIWRKWKGMTGW